MSSSAVACHRVKVMHRLVHKGPAIHQVAYICPPCRQKLSYSRRAAWQVADRFPSQRRTFTCNRPLSIHTEDAGSHDAAQSKTGDRPKAELLAQAKESSEPTTRPVDKVADAVNPTSDLGLPQGDDPSSRQQILQRHGQEKEPLVPGRAKAGQRRKRKKNRKVEGAPAIRRVAVNSRLLAKLSSQRREILRDFESWRQSIAIGGRKKRHTGSKELLTTQRDLVERVRKLENAMNRASEAERSSGSENHDAFHNLRKGVGKIAGILQRPVETDLRPILKTSEGQSIERVFGNQTISAALGGSDEATRAVSRKQNTDSKGHPKLSGRKISFLPIKVKQPPVRPLSYGLDRALFNPGVYLLQDPRSGAYNFDPYLQKLLSVKDFNFDLLPGFITSSKDTALADIARSHNKKYTGSSSSLTGVLSQFHFLLSRFRPINLSMLSRTFPVSEFHSKFTDITKAPAAIFLRYRDGRYAIDSDKEFASTNVLSLLGQSLEKLLTLPKNEYEKYRIGSPEQLTDAARNAPETYHYTSAGDILMRSQLDAHDPRLPGTGMFDLKTRAVVSIRMDVHNYLEMRDYEIKHMHGQYESFEREYLDMLRATMVKYMLQVRIGRMDGIFVAYHNTQRTFGFQYIPLDEIDFALHGQSDTSLGDQEFRLSVKLMNEVLNKVTERFPETSIRMHWHTTGGANMTNMQIFAEPVSEAKAEEMQSRNDALIARMTKNLMDGKPPLFGEGGTSSQGKSSEVGNDPQKNGTEGAPAPIFDSSTSEPVSLERETSDQVLQFKPQLLATTPDAVLSSKKDSSAGAPQETAPRLQHLNESSEESAETEPSSSPIKNELEARETAEYEALQTSETPFQAPVNSTSSNDIIENEEDVESPTERATARSPILEEGSTRAGQGETAAEDEDLEDSGPQTEAAALLATSNSPLLALRLTVNNFQNGTAVYVPGYYGRKPDDPHSASRMSDYSPVFSKERGDSWDVDWQLTEITDPKRAWELYLACQTKRSRLMTLVSDEDSGLTYIRNNLRKWAEKGREYRQHRNKEEGQQKPVLLGDKRPALRKGKVVNL